MLNDKEGDTNGSHCILNGFVLHSDVTLNILLSCHWTKIGSLAVVRQELAWWWYSDWVTGWTTDESEFDYRKGKQNFHLHWNVPKGSGIGPACIQRLIEALFSGGWDERVDDYWPPSSAQVNEWSCTSIAPHPFITASLWLITITPYHEGCDTDLPHTTWKSSAADWINPSNVE